MISKYGLTRFFLIFNFKSRLAFSMNASAFITPIYFSHDIIRLKCIASIYFIVKTLSVYTFVEQHIF